MKKIILVTVLAFMSAMLHAQAPTLFNYQAVARDASGTVLPNQNVAVRISIISGNANGFTEYAEEHVVTTNAFGLFNFRIGEGNLPSGDLNTIDWSANDFFIKVEFDAAGGSNFTELSTSQLVSVPFALFANDVLNDQVNDADADPANEIQTISFSSDTLFLSDGGNVYLGAYANQVNNDNDATNEIQVLSFSNDTLYLSNGGNVYLGAYTNAVNNDNDSTNEIQALSFSSDTLYLSDGGSVYLGGYTNEINNDNDSTNEIQFVVFSGDTLYLSDGGNVYLGDYANEVNLDNDPTNEIQVVSFSGDTLYLSDGGSVYLGDYTNEVNLDNDPTNEIQVVSFSGDTLYLSDGGSVYLGAYTNAVNNDNDPTNEIQSVSISNDTIYLSDGGFVKLPAGFDGQYASLTGAPTNVSTFTNDAGYLTTENDGDPNNEIQVLSISNDTIYLTNGGFVKLPAAAGGLPNGVAAGNTLYWNGTSWVTNNSNIHNNGGNVGIGTTSPSGRLDVAGPTTAGSSSLTLRNGDNNVGAQGAAQISMGFNNTDTYRHYIRTRHNAANASNAIEFYVSDGVQNGVFPTNAVHNLSLVSGRVGVGTTAPENRLHVEDLASEHVAIQIENNDAVGGIEFETQSATAVGEAIMNIGVHTNRALLDKGTNPTGLWMRMDSRATSKSFDWYAEDAGSNTESHLMKLTHTGNLTLNSAYTLPNVDGAAGQVLTTNGSGTVSWQPAAGGDADWTISGANMHSGVTGNVGIGTTNPAGKLTIGNNIASGGLDNYSEYQLVLYQTPAAANAYGMGVRGGAFVINTDDRIEFDVDGEFAWRFRKSRLETLGSGNSVFIGNGAGVADDLSENRNVGIGYAAMLANTTGSLSVGIGANALDANTTGYNNVAVGGSAMGSNTTGYGNTAVGRGALFTNTVDSLSTAVGFEALLLNTASANTAVGYGAAAANTTGVKNTAIGANTLAANTTGFQHTVVGYGAGNAGVYTTIIGHTAGAANTAGYTTAVGDRTLLNNTTGNANTAVGGRAMQNNVTGSENVAMGYGAAYDNTAGSFITAIGFQAANKTTGNNNTAIGHKALFDNVGGLANVAVGAGAGSSGSGTTSVGWLAAGNNTQNGTTAIGDRALAANTTGLANTAVGFFAGNAVTTGANGTYMGFLAGRFTTSSNVTAIGAFVLEDNTTGSANTGVGSLALSSNTTGGGNTAVGYGSLDASTTGGGNTATGADALTTLTTGSGNTGLGVDALEVLASGNGNSSVGAGAGNDLSSGNFNSFFGQTAGNAAAAYTRNNVTALGYNAPVGADNSVRLGNTAVTSIGGFAPYANLSDGRFKTNVQEDVPGLDFIKGLRPVTYKIDINGLNSFLYGDDMDDEFKQLAQDAHNGRVESGFIAQEVEALAQSLGYKFSGVNKPASDSEHYSLAYSTFVVPLVKATQEQQAIIEQQQKEIDELRNMVEALLNK